MKFIKIKTFLLGISLLVLTNCTNAQILQHHVKIIGQMKDVMWKGQLDGKISLDTISNKKNLYGLGPVEYLSGEILILDGKAYKSTVVTDTRMKVEESFNMKAPFFGYSNISDWTEQNLPDSIETISQLEKYLDQISLNAIRPFMFKLNGIVNQATIHIVNLPKGSKVSSPDEAHVGQINYELSNVKSDILGFFSTKHKAIFTHHDTYLHMHLITSDKQKMGHLDKVKFKTGSMKLFLPKN